jgi:hypothetical protein
LFQVDWQRIPVARELTLHARFSIPEGRKFDATTQVKIVPPGAGETLADEFSKESAATASSQPKVTPRRSRTMHSASAATVSDPAEFRAGTTSSNARRKVDSGSARFEQSTTTSDRWTEESIPTLR